MRKSKFTEEQKVEILNIENTNTTVNDICTKYNISLGTYYKWRSKYRSMSLFDVDRIEWLEHLNRHLNKLYEQSLLDNKALQEALEGKY
jgi:putative transposase